MNPERALLLWQVADLLSQLAYMRTWWAAREPETYGEWVRDAS